MKGILKDTRLRLLDSRRYRFTESVPRFTKWWLILKEDCFILQVKIKGYVS